MGQEQVRKGSRLASAADGIPMSLLHVLYGSSQSQSQDMSCTGKHDRGAVSQHEVLSE